MDYALTRDQTLRLSYDQGRNTQENLGVGGSDLTERAYSTTSQDHELRAQVVGPLGRRTFANTRAAAAVAGLRRGVGHRRADRRRQRRVHQRRRAGVRRTPSADLRSGLRRGLRARTAHGADGVPRRRRQLPLRQRDQPAGHLHLLEHRRLQRRHARHLHAAHRRPAGSTYFNAQTARLRPGRHPRPQEPDAQPGPALRSPDAPERPRQPRAAHGRSPGRRSRAAARRCAAATAFSTTG